MTMLVIGAPVVHGNRVFNAAVVVHRGSILGVAPKSYLPNYREFYERRWFAPGDDRELEDHRRRPGRPFGPDLIFRPRRPRPRPARRGVRGHVGAGAAERRGRAGRRDGARQPVAAADHDRPRGGPAAAGPHASARCTAAYVYAAAGQGESTTDLSLGRPDDGLRVRLAARRERAVPRRPRRTVVDVDLDRSARSGCVRGPSTTTAAPTRAGRPVPHRRVGARAADRRHRAAAQGRPLPVRARRRRAAGPRLLRGLQHPGHRARAAAQRHRLAQGRDRRQRRPRLDPRADRRLQGDGPARSSAQRHARVHDARLRDGGDHQVVRHPARAVARRDVRGARHPARGRADARATSATPSAAARRSTTSPSRTSRPACARLPLPARQPARRHRRSAPATCRSSRSAGAPTAWATRCRTTRQRRRAEDARSST